MAPPPVQRNPYVIGRPIFEPEMFFGRESLFQFIEDNLEQGAKIILSFDLQDKGYLPLSNVLSNLADEIVEQLELNLDQLTLPSPVALENNSRIFTEEFLPQIYRALDKKKLVLLLDEFDVLNSYDPNSAIEHFFPYLERILKQQDQLSIIPVIGRRIEDIPKLLSLFKEAPSQEIGLLDEFNAKQLITKPVEGILEYQPDAIQAILKLSAGHPYFTQVICHALYGKARSEHIQRITQTDVEKIINRAIEISEGGLAWFRDGLPIPERIVFLTIAEIQQRNTLILTANENSESGVIEGEPLSLLQELGVVLTESLQRAEERLIEWQFLKYVEQAQGIISSNPKAYKITIELVRLWLIRRYSLRRAMRDLENLNQDLDGSYSKAVALYQQGEKFRAIEQYQRILASNPNHFSALFELLKIYLEVKDFSKAKELYKRVHKVDPLQFDDEDFVLKELEVSNPSDRLQASPSKQIQRISIILAFVSVAAGVASIPFLTTKSTCPSGHLNNDGVCVPIVTATPPISTTPSISTTPYHAFADVPNVPKMTVRYGGSTTFAPLRSPDFVNQIKLSHPGFRLVYQEPSAPKKPGSGSGIRMLIEGQIDIAQSSRPLREEEYAMAREQGLTLEQIPVAVDGIAFYVNPQLKIPGLNLSQIKGIYTGKITNWQQVGGPDRKISPFSLDPQNGGTPEYFEAEVLQKEPLSPSVRLLENTTTSLSAVATNPGGIGYSATSEICTQATIKSLPIAKEAEQNFINPCINGNIINKQALTDGIYPVARMLFIILKRDDSRDRQAGIAYANLLLSDEGQNLVSLAGFAPIRSISPQ